MSTKSVQYALNNAVLLVAHGIVKVKEGQPVSVLLEALSKSLLDLSDRLEGYTSAPAAKPAAVKPKAAPVVEEEAEEEEVEEEAPPPPKPKAKPAAKPAPVKAKPAPVAEVEDDDAFNDEIPF